MCKHGDIVRLQSPRGRDMGVMIPELVAEILAISADVVADAELVVLDDQGRPQWDRLHRPQLAQDEDGDRRHT